MQVVTNIKGLVQVLPASVRKVCGKDMQDLKVLKNAFLLFDKGRIVDNGSIALHGVRHLRRASS